MNSFSDKPLSQGVVQLRGSRKMIGPLTEDEAELLLDRQIAQGGSVSPEDLVDPFETLEEVMGASSTRLSMET